MPWIIQRLGNGQFGLIDTSNPDGPPAVTASVSSPTYDSFTRIMMGQFTASEEVRRDVPASYTAGYEFIAVAPDGSDPEVPVWDCVRCTWEDKKKTRFQYRQAISWTDRNIGW